MQGALSGASSFDNSHTRCLALTLRENHADEEEVLGCRVVGHAGEYPGGMTGRRLKPHLRIDRFAQ